MTDRGYTTQKKMEDYLGGTAITISVSPFILSAQKFIEDYCQRVFKADTVATARLFDGKGSNSLRIDDCVEITKVEIGQDQYGDSFIEDDLTKIKTLPNNAVVLGLPITEVVSRNYEFICGLQNHKITAKWGYTDCIPEDIQFVATVLACGMYKNAQGGGAVKSESIGAYSVSYENLQNWSDFSSINLVLDNYKKYGL